MIICIDIGNSQIHIGVFVQDKLITQFRYNSSSGMTSDQFGIFLKMILVEKDINYREIKNIAISISLSHTTHTNINNLQNLKFLKI